MILNNIDNFKSQIRADLYKELDKKYTSNEAKFNIDFIVDLVIYLEHPYSYKMTYLINEGYIIFYKNKSNYFFTMCIGNDLISYCIKKSQFGESIYNNSCLIIDRQGVDELKKILDNFMENKQPVNAETKIFDEKFYNLIKIKKTYMIKKVEHNLLNEVRELTHKLTPYKKGDKFRDSDGEILINSIKVIFDSGEDEYHITFYGKDTKTEKWRTCYLSDEILWEEIDKNE